MPTRRVFTQLAASALLCAFTAHGQDSQSLGDAARQTRQQKQQKDAQAKDAPTKSPHVITNDEIPSHLTTTKPAAGGPQTADEPDAALSSSDQDALAEQLRSRIQAQKSAIASLQSQIADLSESVHYAGETVLPIACIGTSARRKSRIGWNP